MRVFVGTYSRSTGFCDGKGRGIHRFELNPETGELWECAGPTAAVNPSYLCISANHRYLYAVNEVGDGALSAYRMDGEELTLLNQKPTRGADPCHVATDKNGLFVLAANYSSGSLCRYPMCADGSIGDSGLFVQHEGKGVNPERQEGPHAHSVVFTQDEQYAVGVDLGIDRLKIYRTEDFSEVGAFAMTPGVGPRFCLFNKAGNRCYVICELASAVWVLGYDGAGEFSALQQISTLPQGFAGDNTGADLRLSTDGSFLYASNRGHDSIACYRVGEDGRLSFLEAVKTAGRTPRGFALDPTGQWLLAGNQDSDTIAVFARNRETGRLTFQRLAEAPSPVCILFE